MLGEGDNTPLALTQITRLQNEPAIRSPEKLRQINTGSSPPSQRGHLWCVNLGEQEFDIGQLVRLRQALPMPTCLVTHMFIDSQKLPQRYEEPTSPNAH